MDSDHREGIAPSGDELAILRLINRWMVLRDGGDWERLRPIWHADGRMKALWRHGTADDFIAGSKAGWGKGLSVFHELGAVLIDLKGDRAISQNKMTISARGDLDGVLCEVSSMARHLDRWEKRQGHWGLVLRETVYDRDHLFAVAPGAAVHIDEALMRSFPEAYRGLGYLMTRLGYPIPTDLPVFDGEEERTCLDASRRWLDGTD